MIPPFLQLKFKTKNIRYSILQKNENAILHIKKTKYEYFAFGETHIYKNNTFFPFVSFLCAVKLNFITDTSKKITRKVSPKSYEEKKRNEIIKNICLLKFPT